MSIVIYLISNLHCLIEVGLLLSKEKFIDLKWDLLKVYDYALLIVIDLYY